MKRLRLYDMRLGRLPSVVGLCQSDIIGLATYCNSAQQRLIYAKEAGEEGWFGTFAEIVFNVSRALPYITLPREVARLQIVSPCTNPIMVQNQFYEYLLFGNGRLPKTSACGKRDIIQCVSRNNVPTYVDLSGAPQILRLYPTDSQDTNKRVLIQGLDQNGVEIHTLDGQNQVNGVFVTLSSPFVDAPTQFNKITGIQKDVTVGEVKLYQVDPTDGEEVLLSTFAPGEQTGWYRRYYLDQLPCGCCAQPGQVSTCPNVQVTAIAKLEPIPVRVDTDYFLIQNEEALIEECQSVRYSAVDTVAAKQMATERHIQAVRLLNGELNHYLGKESVSISIAPFGSARLEYQKIGTLI